MGLERYQPFGLIFDKAYVFSLGGRPVIYQKAEEFDQLSESIRWRHVTYNPCFPNKDFTWEREWRVLDRLDFSSESCRVLVPNASFKRELFYLLNEAAETDKSLKFQQYSLILGDDIARQLVDFSLELNWVTETIFDKG